MAVNFRQVDTQFGPILAIWEGLGDAETGPGAAMVGRSDMTATCHGTFGAATVHLEGSNDNSNWFPCIDFLGAVITFTVAGMRTLGSSPIYFRARTTGGTGTSATLMLAGKPAKW